MTIPATPTTDAGPRYGGLWIRGLAYLIDGLILAFLYLPIVAIHDLVALDLGVSPETTYESQSLRTKLAHMVVYWLYFAMMESSKYQATLGKRAFRLMVTDLGGRRIGFWRATGRYFAKFVSGAILLVGYLMIGWTERKQGLHDKMASTLVVRGRPGSAESGPGVALSVVRRGE